MTVSDYVNKLRNIRNSLAHNVDQKSLSSITYKKEIASDVMSILDVLIGYYTNKGKFAEAEYLKKKRAILFFSDSLEQIQSIIEDVLSIIQEHPELQSLSRKTSSEELFEKRLKRIEYELDRLGSNPALEKKVAELETELGKLRAASILRVAEDGKEQKDILKKFKSAEKKVFVVMPFDPIFKDVWKGAIERACNSEGFACLRVDEISLSTWITEDIKTYLGMSDVVITDITGNNPNVMFELGWALAKDKKLIAIRQQNDPNAVPFDVKDIRYIPYINSWSGIEKLFIDICSFIKSTSETLGEKTAKKGKDKSKS